MSQLDPAGRIFVWQKREEWILGRKRNPFFLAKSHGGHKACEWLGLDKTQGKMKPRGSQAQLVEGKLGAC